ncbi:MAG: hypothetical protein ACRDPK_01545 [Carbonactinosporaceae bacterium]
MLDEDVARERVGGQPRAAPAGWQKGLRRPEEDSAAVVARDVDRNDQRESIRADPAEQHVRQARRCPGGAVALDARAGAAGGRSLRRWVLGWRWRPVYLRGSARSQIRPDEHALHRDVDYHPRVVDAQPSPPQRAAAWPVGTCGPSGPP